ncbi:DMT family transporter [Gymnodinialimonas ceratoperidinii]|uniref:DMT family transporter n=1 Tax=Gymnodinialimonas ceratoperidinii TaxID=2856823 RepID=A0A8F6TW23_9RHOB|nr:DMT family transporter [Gymnodinialimonas ceratoperidinii]QXT38777.1 DMT family transporter [Gymnodinialimonas ceratoperidinii]
MDNLKGMGWMTLAMLGFALADTFIKLTLGALPVGQVVAIFGFGGALVFGVWAAIKGERIADRALFTRPFVFRLMSEILGTMCFTFALSVIDLSLLSAIIQANPLMVTLGAALFLGASVGWRRWVAILIGLVGVLIIVRPGLEGFDANSLWALGAVIGLTGRDLATRAISREVSTHLLAAWGFLAAGIAGLILLAGTGGAALPDALLTAQLCAALVFALVAYYAVTAAMRVGDIPTVTPFRYTRLVFALILAFVVFNERPDQWTLIGAGIVIATGLYTLWRERLSLQG